VNNRPARIFFLLVIVIITSIALMNLVTSPDSDAGSLSHGVDFLTLMRDIRAGKVATVDWQQSTLSGKYVVNDERYATQFIPPESPNANVVFEAVMAAPNPIRMRFLSPPATSTILSIFGVIAFPLMLIALIYFLVLRPAQIASRR
jgi:hypothetical protein